MDVLFKLEKEFANAVRYDEVDGKGDVLTVKDHPKQCQIGMLYIRKIALPKSIPQRLRVTIEEA